MVLQRVGAVNTLTVKEFSKGKPGMHSSIHVFAVNNFENTEAMRLNFFLKMFKILCRF